MSLYSPKKKYEVMAPCSNHLEVTGGRMEERWRKDERESEKRWLRDGGEIEEG